MLIAAVGLLTLIAVVIATGEHVRASYSADDIATQIARAATRSSLRVACDAQSAIDTASGCGADEQACNTAGLAIGTPYYDIDAVEAFQSYTASQLEARGVSIDTTRVSVQSVRMGIWDSGTNQVASGMATQQFGHLTFTGVSPTGVSPVVIEAEVTVDIESLSGNLVSELTASKLLASGTGWAVADISHAPWFDPAELQYYTGLPSLAVEETC